VSAPVRAPTLIFSAAESAFSASTTKRARRTPDERIGDGVTTMALEYCGVSIRMILRSLPELCQRCADPRLELRAPALHFNLLTS
jgi:hypothetical protein